jgi:hypothetical protein
MKVFNGCKADNRMGYGTTGIRLSVWYPLKIFIRFDATRITDGFFNG